MLPVSAGPTHRYLPSSPACFAAYGTVLAGAYEDAARRRVYQLAVDAWSVQHPGGPSRVTNQSTALHLMTLHLCLEADADPADGPALHKRMMARRVSYDRLEPPAARGDVTVATLVPAQSTDEHVRLVWAWARAAWTAWAPHHDRVRRWVDAWQARLTV